MRILASIVTACLLSAQAAAATISIRADEWYPVNGLPSDKDDLGLFIDLATAVFANAGHTVDYQTMPWRDALAATEKGEVDCVVGAYKSDAPSFVYPARPFAITQEHIYVRKGREINYTKPEDLQNLRLAHVPSYAASDAIDAYIKANVGNPDRIVSLPSQNRALRNAIMRVAIGQIDAILETNMVMQATLKRMRMEGQLESAAPIGTPNDTYIACSPAKPSSKEYVELIDRTIPLMRASGDLQRIYDKYGVTPPP